MIDAVFVELVDTGQGSQPLPLLKLTHTNNTPETEIVSRTRLKSFFFILGEGKFVTPSGISAVMSVLDKHIQGHFS